jgi:hypothetical protein
MKVINVSIQCNAEKYNQCVAKYGWGSMAWRDGGVAGVRLY